ncbi:MAG: lipase family protein [Bacteroidia bacterium]
MGEVEKIDFGKILSYAKLAELAYKSDEEIRKACGKTVKIFLLPETDGKCFVKTNDRSKTHIVSIRGTADFKNFLVDGKCWKVKNETLGIRVHAGFNVLAMEVVKAITPNLKKYYSINIVGHSLGGAGAAIVGLMLKEMGFEVKEVLTYGQPKIMSKSGCEKYKDFPLLRIVDHEDLVTNLPPTTLLSFLNWGVFRHFGNEILLLDGKSYEVLDKDQASRLLLSSFWLHLGDEDVEDHFVKKYIVSLKEKVK